MRHRLLLIIAGLAVFALAGGACPDFMDLTYAEAFTGYTSNTFASQGAAVYGRHTVITQQGTDCNRQKHTKLNRLET